MAPTLTIPRAIFDAMLAHATGELPNECCGLLAGSENRVSRHFPLVNELNSPTAYRSEPASLFAAVKAMRSAGTEIVAVYHSHPTSEPIPSKRDLAENLYPGVVHAIIGLAGTDPLVRAWRMAAAGLSEVKLDFLE